MASFQYLWVILVVAGILALLAHQLKQSYDSALNAGYEDASNQVWALNGYLDMTLQHVKGDLELVRTELARETSAQQWSSARPEGWQNSLQVLKNGASEIDSLWIIDARGDMIATTAPTTQLNIADRLHFQRLRDNPNAGLVVSKVISSRVNGANTIAIAIARRDSSGKFDGIISALIDFANIQKVFAAFTGNSTTTITLRSIDDHALILRQSLLPDSAMDNPDRAYRTQIEAGQKSGNASYRVASTGKERIGSFRILDEFPFYVTVDLERDKVLAAWRREALITGLAALILLASLVFVFYRIRLEQIKQREMVRRLEAAFSEQRQQNQTLAETEDSHRQLLQRLQVGIVVHGPDSTIRFSNPRASELLGLSEDQMRGKAAIDPAWCFLNEAGAPFRVEDYPVSRVINTGLPMEECILGINRPGGDEIAWVLVNAFPEIDRNGQLKEVVVNFHDVTERKLARDELLHQRTHLAELVQDRTLELSRALELVRRTQDDLVQAEKLASLGSMVAGLSHELNTPLGNTLLAASTLENLFKGINEMTQMGNLKRTSFDEFLESGTEMSNLIFRSSQRAADMVSSFKQVAVDQTSEQRRSFELSDIVRDNLSALMPRFKMVRFVLDNAVPAGIVCNSYPGPLGQILTNLIQNAVVHGLAERSDGTITISAECDAQLVKVIIQDDGLGMAPSVMTHIFDPFFTTKMGMGGSGLGLSISRRIATSVLGGDLKADSTPGQGSAFTLIFPKVAPFPI